MNRSRAAGLAILTAGAGAALVNRRQIAAWRANVDPDGPDAMRFPDGDERVVTTSDGARLAVTIVGEGPPVVLAHGWTNARSVWAPVARRLVRAGHRVIAYDQRGHGVSTTGSEPFSVARLGFDLRDLLIELDVHDAVLVGHSMGGMTIMSLIGEDAVAVKESARAVVLVATAASGLGRHPAADAAIARIITGRGARAAIASPLGPRLVRGAYGAKPRYAHLEAMRAMAAATPGPVMADAFVSMASMDLRSGLAGCPVPATVVVGTRDRLTRRTFARAIADAIPDAELVVYEGAGHMLPLEEPNRLVEIITRSSSSV
ncbi:MAG: alpha/beta fold hydrolase [Acidimicrobiales bacterium]